MTHGLVCLVRIPGQIASAMMKGSLEEDQAALSSGAASSGQDPGTVAAIEAALVYLRDRVSKPGCMGDQSSTDVPKCPSPSYYG